MLDRLAIPLIQAPMLGASTRAMTIAVSEAGGLGSVAGAGLTPAALTDEVAAIRSATDRPFAVNLFVQPTIQPDSATIAAAIARLKPWREALALADQAIPNQWSEPFAPQLAALIEAAPPAASFTFGILSAEQVAALASRGVYVMGTATTVAEARAWQAVGADAIVAQGYEAGGHRGTFLKPVEDSLVGTLSLVRTIRAAVDLPVIAAGGVGDGASLAAVLALGAVAAQVGTAFLRAPESAISAPWRDRLAARADDATRLTRAFSGRHARGIENRFMREMRAVESEIPAYPIQNALTQDLRAAAAKQGDADVLSLWAGQSAVLAEARPSADIVHELWAGACATLRGLAERLPAPSIASNTPA